MGLEKAANKDWSPAQFELAVMYCQGQGLPRDLPRAIHWYELAAEMGHRYAQYNLGIMQYKGQGCVPDKAKAISWLREAAAQGIAEAKAVLAKIEAIAAPASQSENGIASDRERSPGGVIPNVEAEKFEKTVSETPSAVSIVDPMPNEGPKALLTSSPGATDDVDVAAASSGSVDQQPSPPPIKQPIATAEDARE